MQSVEVSTRRPAFQGRREWWRKVARSLGLHHENTAEGLLRRFVSLEPGQVCTEFRRSESERILRAQPYLADATVTTTRVANGVRVDVETIDEVPVVVSGRFRDVSLQALSLGTMNFRGAGMHLEGRWQSGRGVHREGMGGRVSHPQLFGRPYSLDVEGERRPIGENFTASLSHPFLTDLQRVAWHAGYEMSKDLARLRRPDRSELAQPVDRAMWNVGGVVRFGPPRRLGLIGGMLVGERLAPRHQFSLIGSKDRLLPTTDTAGVVQYSNYDAAHVAGVLGLRALRYTRMRGLDALAADQDVATGTQIGTMLGMRTFSSDILSESFALVDTYAGARTRRSFAGVRAEAESRLDLARGEWRHLIIGGRAAWYVKPREHWVSELSIEGAGIWRPILPLQLELGERRTGVRGYADSREAGAQRLLLRLEQRVEAGRYRVSRAAIGVAAFTDAGRIWSGDVPFGVDTPIRTSVGVALLAAVPANSQRTMRAELAVPLVRTTGAGPELRFAIRHAASGFWTESPPLRWARLSAVPEQIFSWP